MIKPLVGAADDGPGDAAVILPVRGSTRGLAVGCGLNPRYGKIDPYHMAACVIDEAIRNCVAVGADPGADRAPRQFLLGQHRAARDPGLAGPGGGGMPRHGLGVRYAVYLGQGQPVQRIHARRPEPGDPAHALDQRHRPGARRRPVRDDGFQGTGQPDFAFGNHPSRAGWVDLGRPTISRARAACPGSISPLGRRLFAALHAAICRGLVRSCHDLSEGGLAVALAEMAIAGGLGADVSLSAVPRDDDAAADPVLLFSESPTRFLLEVSPECLGELSGRSCRFAARPARPGDRRAPTTTEPATARLIVRGLDDRVVIDATVADLKAAWQRPLALVLTGVS